MSSVQAALGIAQMERIDQLVKKKREIFYYYQDRLGQNSDLCLNAEPKNVWNSYWMVTIVPQGPNVPEKFSLQESLFQKKIDSRPFFSRLSTLKPYEANQENKRTLRSEPNGAYVARHGLNLPSGYNMNEALVDRVCSELIKLL